MKIYTVDLASRLRVSARHLKRLIDSGAIPPAAGRDRKGCYWRGDSKMLLIIEQQRRPERQGAKL